MHFLIPLGSSGVGSRSGISREEAAEILKVSKAQRPVARVKPIVKLEESPTTNLLGEILGRQKEFLKASDPGSSNFSTTKKRAIQEVLKEKRHFFVEASLLSKLGLSYDAVSKQNYENVWIIFFLLFIDSKSQTFS